MNQKYMPNKIRFLFLISLALFVLHSGALAQPRQAASIVHDIHKIKSKSVSEERTILVHLPANYLKTNKKYPVIYMLDGHYPQPGMMGAILDQQAWGYQIPEMILVSIQNTDRSRDLTPTDDGKGGSVGGGSKFLDFIEKELIPLIEKKYRTEPYRIFAGHSLGGLTVVYALASRPDLFNAYIAASPVLHFHKDFVIEETEKLFEAENTLDKTIFLGLGNEPEYKNGWNRFKKLLKNKKPKNFDYEFREFPTDNHASVVMPVYYAGLRKIFEDWIPRQNGSVVDLERHYKKLTKKYGYEILIPEATLNQIGYQFLRTGKKLEAIKVFKKNAENYPDSANVYDSLGDAYEKNGSTERARENYEKAYKLALKNGDTRLATVFKSNLTRVSKKLR